MNTLKSKEISEALSIKAAKGVGSERPLDPATAESRRTGPNRNPLAVDQYIRAQDAMLTAAERHVAAINEDEREGHALKEKLQKSRFGRFALGAGLVRTELPYQEAKGREDLNEFIDTSESHEQLQNEAEYNLKQNIGVIYDQAVEDAKRDGVTINTATPQEAETNKET